MTHSDLARVAENIGAIILAFRDGRGGLAFHNEDLLTFVRERSGLPVAPDSPGRVMRQLRSRGDLDYDVVDRRKSLYRFAGQA